MRMQFLSMAFFACCACLSVVSELPAPVERQVTVAEIDFEALHNQASIALEKLRQSREGRMAMASAAAF